MRSQVVMICIVALLAMAGTAVAERCLGADEARIVWCDDFDNYCVGGAAWPGYPPFPARCPEDGTAVADLATFYAQWPKSGDCGTDHLLNTEPTQLHNPPFGVTMPGDALLPAARHTHSLAGAITAREAGKNAINGTDENPLVLTYFMEFGTAGSGPNSPMYVELTLGDDRAPTDYVLADCLQLNGNWQGPYPIVCQQWQSMQTPVPCPPKSDAVHASLAFGVMAFLDRYPCDVETGRRPTTYHAAVFDGNQWWDPRSNVFPGNGGDFDVPGSAGSSVCWFTITVKTSTFVIELDSPAEYSIGTVPRQYLGPFDTVAFGTGQGCELDPVTGECIGPYKCFDHNETANESWSDVHLDTPVLLDGVLVSLEGACCKPDGTCEVVSEDVCVNTYGGTFAGIDTTCDDVVCCPQPFADADVDGDVDQADFGAWQLCYTNTNGGVLAGCECFNRDDDNDVDGDDFLAFSACWSGAGIAADPNCE